MNLTKLFSDHIRQRIETTTAILAECGYEGIVLDAGLPGHYFEDDHGWPHRPNHHFAHWCPVPAPGSLIIFTPAQKPVLLFLSEADFWHDQPELGPGFWQRNFDIRIVGSDAELWQGVAGLPRHVYHGPRPEAARTAGLQADSSGGLLPRLNWERSFKSPYEIECMLGATRKAALGHNTARQAFLAGASEREIYQQYLLATGDLEKEMPYSAIVCLDEKAAILHYTQKRAEARRGRVLLIDAGTQLHGYACDITRTWTAQDCMDVFRGLVGGMNTLQQEVCAAVKPGRGMMDLHRLTHEKTARLLLEAGILRGADQDAVLRKGLTLPFFPHGLGHLLGLFVHDVAGKQRSRAGDPVDTGGMTNEPALRYLRCDRTLEQDMVVTIEPGLYFIPMLLDPYRNGPDRLLFNWALIDDLMPCGGIRIEDDIQVTADGHRNLTREFLGA